MAGLQSKGGGFREAARLLDERLYEKDIRPSVIAKKAPPRGYV
jgi:hypothetical protein